MVNPDLLASLENIITDHLIHSLEPKELEQFITEFQLSVDFIVRIQHKFLLIEESKE